MQKDSNYNKKWYEKNRERILEQRKEYRKRNKEKIQKRQKKYRIKNREKIKKKKRDYYLKNKDKIGLRVKKWINNNKEAPLRYQRKQYSSPQYIYRHLKKRATKRQITVCSKNDFLEWFKSQKKQCCYCDIPLKMILKSNVAKFGKMQFRLQVDRKNPRKGYLIKPINNLSLSCPRCNFIKSNYFTFKEMRRLAQEFIKPKWANEIYQNGKKA
jgi:hypothetical protein